MTATLAKQGTNAESYPHAVLGRGYSDAELSLIKAIWDDTKRVAQQKMQLCIHLYELKQEMDAHDPHAGPGGNGTKSRFWSAFEQGDLPEYVTGNRTRVAEWLQAAEFTVSGSLSGAPDNALLTLTPSTVCNLARIVHPKAKAIAEHHLQVHEFIGHDAAQYLAKTQLDEEVLEGIDSWITDNAEKALVPSVIRQIENKVAELNRPASSQTIPVSDVVESIKREAPAREQKARVDAVKEELSRGDREQHERLQSKVREYNSKLNAVTSSVHELLVFLRSVDRIDGTQYLGDLRSVDVMGLITVHDDLPRLMKVGEELMQAVNLARSSNQPTGIDMTTFTVEAE